MKSGKSNPKIRTKRRGSNNQQTEGKKNACAQRVAVTTEKTINNTKYKVAAYIICTLAILGSSAPFWHKFADKTSITSYFDFKNFYFFLYHFGTHFSLFTTSLFFLWVISFIPNSAKFIKKLITLSALVFMTISLYFLLWVFMPGKGFDFSKNYYGIVAAISSIVLTFALFKLTKASFSYIDNIINNIKYLTNIIRKLTSFIVITGKSHVTDKSKKKKVYL